MQTVQSEEQNQSTTRKDKRQTQKNTEHRTDSERHIDGTTDIEMGRENR